MNSQPTRNPLLDKVRMPGGTFVLPSGGDFYSPDVINFESSAAEVYVSPMTTMDEIAMTSVDKLLNGTAVTEVFSRCIPSVVNPMKLLSSDVDYLMVAMRVVSFGRDTDITYTHNCSPDAKERTYTIDVEAEVMDKTKRLTAEQLNRYSVTLSNNLHVKFMPMTYGGMLQVQGYLDALQRELTKLETAQREAFDAGASNTRQEQAASDRVQKAAMEYFISLMMNTIQSMDGVEDKDQIGEALAAMSIPLREELTRAQRDLDEWGQPRTVRVVCADCKEEMEIPLDLNPVSFFTTRSSRKTQQS